MEPYIYYIGVDLTKNKCAVCSTKTLLAEFFEVSVKTIDRYLSNAYPIPQHLRIYQEPITKLQDKHKNFYK